VVLPQVLELETLHLKEVQLQALALAMLHHKVVLPQAQE